MSSRTQTAPLSLNIVIVGCGIAGLASAYALGSTGHRVTIVESAPLLTDVGAGIQISPNMARILMRWGLGDQLNRSGVQPSAINFRRYENDQLLGLSILGDDVQKRFGAPYWNAHRADLLQMLYDAAKPFISVIQDHVVSVSTSPDGSPFLTTETGQAIHADLIIGADGIKSVVRSFVADDKNRPIPTGDLAYRIIIPTDAFMDDPELMPLVEDPQVTVWMGPLRHIVGYCVSSKKSYNLVLLRPDIGSEESWSAEADPDQVRETYEGWNPRVTKLLAMAKKGMKSRLVVRESMKTWIHPNGRVALIGDACHSMLPYVAQGAAMAVEDASVLGALFSRITSHAQIPALLQAYQSLRLPRATATQLAAKSNQKQFHHPDGPEQEARDKSMRNLMEQALRMKARGDDKPEGAEEVEEENESGDRVRGKMLYTYDTEKVVKEWYQAGGYKIYQDPMEQ